MGVLNITPDSFSDGGTLYRHNRPDLPAIRARAQDMCAQGAAILDIGGESTRPGAEVVPVREELRRVMPALESLLALDTIVSIDTRNPQVARAALAAGAHMINDVNALQAPEMVEALAESDAAVCLMHMQGNPQTMQKQPCYVDVVADVQTFLSQRAQACVEAGIQQDRIVLDPGFGFGKTLAHNLALLRQLQRCRVSDYPLLAGLSRKSMIGALTNRKSTTHRLGGSLAAGVVAALNGADIIRCHDVAETVDALSVVEAVKLEDEQHVQKEHVSV